MNEEELKSELAKYKKLVKAYDSLINSQETELKVRLINEFPSHFNNLSPISSK